MYTSAIMYYYTYIEYRVRIDRSNYLNVPVGYTSDYYWMLWRYNIALSTVR